LFPSGTSIVFAKPRRSTQKGDDRFDFLDEQDRGDALDVHGFCLLRRIGANGSKSKAQKEGGEDREKGAHGEETP